MLSELCIGYLRLSVDDGDFEQNKDKLESNSITNQRELLADYYARKLTSEKYTYLELADDGYSGTNFNRPEVKKLLDLIKQGRVKCIVVKDISRFSRDYIEVGNFLERIFPLMGIRFISINDNYDSKKSRHETAGMDMAFRNLIYSLYSKDLSVKILSAREIRIRKGYFTGGMPPFGYRFETADKRTLIVDEVAAKYVKYIFDLTRTLSGTGEIACKLNQERLPTPAVYKNSNDNIYPVDKNNQFWNPKKVRTIIQNEVYLGTVVNRKYRAVEIGAKRFYRVPDEERAFRYSQHEPIVPAELFESAQGILRNAGTQKYKKHKQNPENILGGFLYCPICHKALAFSHGRNSSFYFCQRPAFVQEAGCPDIKLYKHKIEQVVLNCIHLLADNQTLQYDALVDKENYVLKADNLMITIEQLKLKRQGLHEKYRSGMLSRDALKRERGILGGKIEDAQEQLIILQETMAEQASSLQQSKESTQVLILTKEVLRTNINKIWVYDEDRIEIIWK